MRTDKLQGVVIAIPTPLTEQEDIDIPSLKALLDYCIGEGVNAVMVSGTMGEGASLLDSQKQLLVETTVEYVNHRVPVLATVSGSSTRRNIEDAKTIDRYDVDYVVCTSAYYYKYPDPASVIQHVERIVDVVDKPVIFYNAPLFTGNPVSTDVLDQILNMEGVSGIKDSSCNYGNFVELLRRYPDKDRRPATIMQGDESVFDSSLLMGADGLVSGGGVLFIKLLKELYEAGSGGRKQDSMVLQREFTNKLLGVLLPDSQRNWLFNIKKGLTDSRVINSAYVTAPFMGDTF